MRIKALTIEIDWVPEYEVYIAQIETFPDVMAVGKTVPEALHNSFEMVELYLDSKKVPA
jgi:predicted RNase H-like HicB family nuclease